MLIDHLKNRLSSLQMQSLRRERRTTESACGPRVRVRRADGSSRDMLAFSSNDYLGLAAHPALAAALEAGVQRYGLSSGASHLVSGHSQAHDALEGELAAWLSHWIPGARALSFGSGYMANLALLTALGDDQATFVADKLNHASLIDGSLLARATFRRYAHGNLAVLERELDRSTTPVRLIVTDAVFSMDGELADLRALLALAERYDAWIVADDAHGFGVIGAGGRGSLAHWGLRSERVILMGTLSKAAGVAGAFVAAHPVVIETLIQSARPYIYTTASPPALAEALCASLALIGGDEGQARRAHLMQLVADLRTALAELVDRHAHLGWRLAASTTAIQPLIVGDNGVAVALSAALEAQGLWVPAIRPPTVPVGTARLRITLSAAHTRDDIGRLVEGLDHAAQSIRPTREDAGRTESLAHAL